jgi:hypothetical protein
VKGSDFNFGVGQFSDLERSYEKGNKVALHDAISRAKELGVSLPDWAASALQELLIEKWAFKLNTWGGYRELLCKHIRSEVFRSCKLWVGNKHHYKRMPTRCIQEWYDQKLNKLPTGQEEAALQITLVGLKKTPAALTSISLLEKQRYFDAIPKAEKLEHGSLEIAADLEMSSEDYRAFIAASYRDSRKTQISFGYSEAEVRFGLRPEGQFWGPPDGEPPEHIKQILDAEPLPWSEPFPSDEK